MRIHFLGVRGSTPAPGASFLRYGGHTPCLAIAADGADAPTLILDAGTGIRRLTELCGANPFVGTILLTHLHWDHLHGLPFFSAGDREDSRVSVNLPAQADGSSAFDAVARGMSPPHFPIGPDGLHGTWTFENLQPGTAELDGFEVTIAEIPHKGGRTFGYRVTDGRSTVAYLPDHCPTVLGEGPDGLGEYHASAMELAGGVEVLVHDASLVAGELAREATFGHSAAEYAVELARRSAAGRVILFHHKPDRTDDELDGLARRLDDDAFITVATETLELEI